LFGLLDEHEVAENVQKAVALEHFFPEVSSTVPRGMLWVPGPALHFAGMAASVERQEVSCLSAQPSCHVDFIRVGGEVYQGASLETKKSCARITVGLILPHGVPPVLTRARILQFTGCNRQAVNCEQQIHRVVLSGMARNLPGHGRLVLGV